MEWRVGNQQLEMPAGGVAIERSALDAKIVVEFVKAGGTFLPGVSATLLSEDRELTYRALRLRQGDQTASLHAGLVLACDGINGTSLAEQPWATWRTARNSWMGVSTSCAMGCEDIAAGKIQMCVGAGGYVGLVRMAGQHIHLAAALSPDACRNYGGPANLIAKIFASCGKAVPPDLLDLRWQGTGLLSRYRPVLGAHRVLAVGDACGYVEPFTGQGMAWAIESARFATALVPAPHTPWPGHLATRWQRRHHYTIVRQRRWCRVLRAMIHRPALTAAAVMMGRFMPKIGALLSARVSGLNREAAFAGVDL